MNLYRGGGLVLKSSPTLVTSWTVAYQAPLSMRFPKEDYWREFLFPSPGYLPDSWVEPESPALQADSLPTEPPGKPKNLYTKQKYTHRHKKQMYSYQRGKRGETN